MRSYRGYLAIICSILLITIAFPNVLNAEDQENLEGPSYSIGSLPRRASSPELVGPVEDAFYVNSSPLCTHPDPRHVEVPDGPLSENCFIDTPVGVADRYGNVYFPYMTDRTEGHIGYKVDQNEAPPARAAVLSNGHSLRFLEVAQNDGGTHFGIYNSALTADDFTDYDNDIDGNKIHAVNRAPAEFLSDENGDPIDIMPGSEVLSQNGTWMTVLGFPLGYGTSSYETEISLYVVNLSSRQTWSLGPVYGEESIHYTAISNTGKTLVAGLGMSVENGFLHRDLSNCNMTSSDKYNEAEACATESFVSAKLQNGQMYEYADVYMTDDTTIQFINYYRGDMSEPITADRIKVKVGDIIIEPDDSPAGGGGQTPSGRTRLDLLAIGDSYISGEGAEYAFNQRGGVSQYRYGTNVRNGNKCHLSEASYPFIIGKRLYGNPGRYDSVACSGAKIWDVVSTSPDYSGQEKRVPWKNISSGSLANIYNSFSPGKIAQYHFVEQYQPRNILLSIGGNDMSFASIVSVCVYTPTDTCFDTAVERWGLLKMIYSKKSALTSTYRKLKEASPKSVIYVTGYPQIVAATKGACSINVQLDPSERSFSRQLVDRINRVIKSAAAEAGVNYVDVSQSFKNRELCSSDAIAVNGITSGDDQIIKEVTVAGHKLFEIGIGNESYHPTAFGHRLLAGSVSRKTNDLSFKNPKPRTSLLPAIDTDTFVTSAKKIPRDPGRFAITALTTNPILKKQREVRVYYDAKIMDLDPRSLYAIKYHSEPVVVYEGQVPEDGIIDVSVITPDLPPGPHTLHIISKDRFGENVDIMQLVYMPHSEDDYDGDGVLNTEDTMPLIPNSGINDNIGSSVSLTATTSIGVVGQSSEPLENNETVPPVSTGAGAKRYSSVKGPSPIDGDDWYIWEAGLCIVGAVAVLGMYYLRRKRYVRT